VIKHSRLDDTLQTRMEHKEFIRNKQQSDSNNPKCPSCQSLMVKRVAKTGSNAGKEFWGCSQFPRCRSIFNVY
ncbi:topoisomerase DNA-binding C4 zinc finger domain-containing protein, partial [Moraxella boevrei]|uniref:topoisomerase DNA-binding C4 zinc finger domain-containing protein n=1 Tax=Faucicola boevrei TaxID=346665 RepID=UPI003735F052